MSSGICAASEISGTQGCEHRAVSGSRPGPRRGRMTDNSNAALLWITQRDRSFTTLYIRSLMDAFSANKTVVVLYNAMHA